MLPVNLTANQKGQYFLSVSCSYFEVVDACKFLYKQLLVYYFVGDFQMLLVQLTVAIFGSHQMMKNGMLTLTLNVIIAFTFKLLAVMTVDSLIYLSGKK